MWVFTPEQVEVLRMELQAKTRLGPKPELVGLGELARRAGCAVQTIRKRLGTELPPGRKLTEGSRALRGFAPDEAKKIVAWARKHFRRRRSASGDAGEADEVTTSVGRGSARFGSSPPSRWSRSPPG
jgi:hypothetical protein